MFKPKLCSSGETPRSAFTPILMVAAILALAFSSIAQAQFHGVAMAKVCSPTARICDIDSDCSDANECTDDVCDTTEPNTTSCQIRATNDDDFGDTLQINEAFDILTTAGGAVRIPAAGNLPISAVSGNTTCVVGAFAVCTIGPDLGGGPGRVTFLSQGYNPVPADLALPNAELLDSGRVVVADLCNAPGTVACNTNPQEQNFGAATDLIDGCSNPFLPDSTPCTDTDGDNCTQAGCDGAGVCDQLHVGPPDCSDDGNECTGDGTCDPATGQCIDGPPLADSTPCTDTDGDNCTQAGCDGAGVCDQLHVGPPDCSEDGNECTGDGTCDPATGQCIDGPPLADSTPCTDTDGDNCTQAGCDGAGVCDQLHVGPPDCSDDGNECTGDGTCDPATGQCIDGPPLADSTPCTDTDGDNCTQAGCDGAGTCDQLHVPPPTCDEFPGGATCNVCDSSTGACVPRDDPPAVCLPGDVICRTPGFWGTHGGTEKKNSTNITQAVIDEAGGLLVCGESITDTHLGHTHSALEAICVSVKGAQELQLARQLTAAALNCVMSGGPADCTGIEIEELYADCNVACVGGVSTRSITECIDEVDCFNNGGEFVAGECKTGVGTCDVSGAACDDDTPCTGIGDTMCVPFETCHDRDLCPDFTDDGELNGSDFCFEPPGAAGSSGACNAATKNTVSIFD